MKGLADQAMSMKSMKAGKEPEEDEDESDPLLVAVDEMFELKGKARADAFRAAMSICSNSGEYEDEE